MVLGGLWLILNRTRWSILVRAATQDREMAAADMRTRSARQMSGGEQQMLTIARTLMGNPRLLLLDEPSEGLSPRIVELMAQAIRRLKEQGLTILVSEQNLRFARFVSDAAVVVERGAVCFSGSLQALETDDAAQRGLRAV